MIRSLDVTFKHEDVQDDKPHVLYTHRNVFPETQKINKVPKKRCQDFFLLFKTHFFYVTVRAVMPGFWVAHKKCGKK
jgi:hypothetical protein